MERRRYPERVTGAYSKSGIVDPPGLGLGNVDALIVLEEFAKVSVGVAFPDDQSAVGAALPELQSAARPAPGAATATAKTAAQSTMRMRFDGPWWAVFIMMFP